MHVHVTEPGVAEPAADGAEGLRPVIGRRQHVEGVQLGELAGGGVVYVEGAPVVRHTQQPGQGPAPAADPLLQPARQRIDQPDVNLDEPVEPFR